MPFRVSETYCVLLVMNVLRMIKLFGWEKHVQQDISAKREEELIYVKKKAIYSMLNVNVKYVLKRQYLGS